jgi:tetratricopeptide (TPR) repeat protein
MKWMVILAACMVFGECNAPASAQPSVPEIVSRCLEGELDSSVRVKNCTSAIAVGVSPAEVLALVYLARAHGYCVSRQYDLAILDQDRAIQLVPNFPQAFIDRANCHFGMGEIKAGIADLDEGIRLAPDVPGFYRQRAKIYNLIGDHDLALADYDQAIRIAPLFNDAVDERAKTLFDLGRFDEAAAGFIVTIRLTPRDPYPVLWLHLSRLRSHVSDTDEFQAGMKTLDLTHWPGPIFDLFQGKYPHGKDALNAMRATAEHAAATPQGGECEGAVFGGEYLLTTNDTAGATALFQEAASVCDPGENRFLTAWAELKRLAPAARAKGTPW